MDEVSFDVQSGEILGLLGRNGAGKTTTIETICGLSRSQFGSVEIFGQSYELSSKSVYEMIGYGPQAISLYPLLTVAENVSLSARLNAGRGKRPADGSDLLERLDLTSLADRRCSDLSGGEQRRVQLAMALVHRPLVVVLDEPTANVDVTSRAMIMEVIRGLRDEGVSVLYTTHYLEEAEALCDRIAILSGGRLVASGSVEALIAEHGIGAIDVVVPAGAVDARLLELLAAIPGVAEVAVVDDGVRILCASPQLALLPTLEVCRTVGAAVTGVSTVEPRLEGAFLRITGDRLLPGRSEV